VSDLWTPVNGASFSEKPVAPSLKHAARRTYSISCPTAKGLLEIISIEKIQSFDHQNRR
jgi:hypothetical protein